MSNRKVTKEARLAYVADRVKQALEGRPVTTQAARDAIRIHGGPDVSIMSRALLASHGVTQWETWKHATAAGRTVDRSQGVEVQGVRQPDQAAWGFMVFPMTPARAPVAPVAPIRAVAPAKVPKPASKAASGAANVKPEVVPGKSALDAALATLRDAMGATREAPKPEAPAMIAPVVATRGDDGPVAVAPAAKPVKGKGRKGKIGPLVWPDAVAAQAACDARAAAREPMGMGAAQILARAGVVPQSRDSRMAEIKRWNAAVAAMPGKSKPPTMKPEDYCDWVERLLPRLVRADGMKPGRAAQMARMAA